MNALKTFLYMGGMHGFFTFYLPWLITQFDHRDPQNTLFFYLAIPFWFVGGGMIVWCSADMVQKGRGTPAHIAPPKHLIINGLYRYVRNPIYLGAMSVQLGCLLWSGSTLLIVYFLFFLLAYQVLIVLIEEPILRHMFGEEYLAYCREVPRWIPKFKSWME